MFNKINSGRLKERKLNIEFTDFPYEVEVRDSADLGWKNFKVEELGYLSLSRILFNSDFTKGYLNYEFYCGTNCFVSNNIEISRSNDKWTVSEYFSGGIA